MQAAWDFAKLVDEDAVDDDDAVKYKKSKSSGEEVKTEASLLGN